MTPDLIYDQMIGIGLRRTPDVLLGRQSRRRLAAPLARCGRDATGRSPLGITEHTHAGMAVAYQAGRGGLPFGLMRGYAATDLAAPANPPECAAHLPVHR